MGDFCVESFSSFCCVFCRFLLFFAVFAKDERITKTPFFGAHLRTCKFWPSAAAAAAAAGTDFISDFNSLKLLCILIYIAPFFCPVLFWFLLGYALDLILLYFF